MKFDLHVHTTHSDGTFTPKEIVDLARKIKLSGIAITDHDTTSGLEIALKYSKSFNDLTIIPGIELSCVHENEEVHILGYYINYNDSNLINTTNKIKKSRVERGLKIIEKLNQLGLDININDVNKFTNNNFVGRPHVARALISRGYVSNMEEAFEKYIKLGAPAYVERYKISIKETINLIKSIGGIPILAHPGLIKNKKILKYCLNKGIKGLEAIHPKHSKEDVHYLIEFAKRNNLLITGGSDFHGDRGYNELLLGKYYVGANTILQLRR